MKIVIDMNLSPQWVAYLSAVGWEATHWMEIGNPAAPDREIMAWAAAHDAIVFTHDLDFGTLLAISGDVGPSVVQVRTQDVLPSAIGPMVLSALDQFRDSLSQGALITIDPERVRARILPLRR